MDQNTSAPRCLRAFLTESACRVWRDIAASAELRQRWAAGRQGTGYEKLDLRIALDERALDPWRQFVEDQIASARGDLGVDSSRGWDAYLLRYDTGAFVPEHCDPTTDTRHLRLNALVTRPADGTGRLDLGGQAIELAEGDAVVFRPDLVPHQVSVVEGERLVLSVGCIF